MRKHTWRGPRDNRERGVAVVEFAVALPLMILLVFGMVEFSVAYNRQQGLHSAAREGARIAALPHTTTDQVVSRVRSALSSVLSDADVQNATITVTPSGNQPCNGVSPGTHVVVTVAAPDRLSIPLFANPALKLTGRSDGLCE